MSQLFRSRSDVETFVHSLLTSSKYPIPVSRLCSEYKLTVGDSLPFHSFGYATIEDYLKSLQGTVRLFCSSGVLYCEGVTDNKNAHIAGLVRGQESSKADKRFKKKLSYGNQFTDPPRRSSAYTGRPPFSRSNPSYDSQRRSQSISSASSYKSNYRSSSHNSSVCERDGYQTKSVPPRFRTQQSSYQRPSSPSTVPTKPRLIRGAMPPTDVPSWPSSTSDSPTPDTANGDAKREFDVTSGRITFTNCDSSQRYDVHELKHRLSQAVVGDTISTNDHSERTAKDFKSDLNHKPNNVDYAAASSTKRKLLQLLDNLCAGLFLDHVEGKYFERFQENLHPDWRSFVQDDNCFELDPTFHGKTILLGKIKSDAFVEEPLKVNSCDIVDVARDAPSPSTIDSSDVTEPSDDASESDALSYAIDDVIDVFVSVANSTTDVWLRPADVFDENNELATAMELHYLKADDRSLLLHPEKVTVGDMYSTEQDATCYRVEVLDVLPNDEYLCRYVDHGEVNTLARSDLWILEQKFKEPRSKAIQCYLNGLEAFHGCDGNVLVNIISKTLVANVVARKNNVHGVVLYDTTSDTDRNLNEELRDLLVKEIRPPHLKSMEDGLSSNVYLAHNAGAGYVYLHLDSVAFDLIERLVDTTADSAKEIGLSSVDANTIYLAKYAEDGFWYRVICSTGSVINKESQIEAYFVDYGNTDLVSLNDMVSLNSCKDPLALLPYQAVKCRLQNVPNSAELEWTKAASDRLDQLAPDSLPLLAKFAPSDSARDVPRVSLFKRMEPNNEIVSINDTLNFERNLFAKKQAATAAATASRRKAKEQFGADVCPVKEVAAAQTAASKRTEPKRRVIESVPLPAVGEKFDVVVTLASNPFNFIMQPWENGKDLDNLLLEMNKFYECQGRPVPYEQVVDNGLYAFKLDGMWCRVRIKQDAYSDLISVFSIDFGDNNVTSVDCLRILEDQFWGLPSQVIRARLSDILPIYKDWQSEDSVFFRELIQDKLFVAVVVGKCAMIDHANETQLVVKLVDTTTDDDVYIHKVLVEKGIAQFKTY